MTIGGLRGTNFLVEKDKSSSHENKVYGVFLEKEFTIVLYANGDEGVTPMPIGDDYTTRSKFGNIDITKSKTPIILTQLKENEKECKTCRLVIPSKFQVASHDTHLLAFLHQRLAHSLSDATPFLADQNNNSQLLLNEPSFITFIVTANIQSLVDMNASEHAKLQRSFGGSDAP